MVRPVALLLPLFLALPAAAQQPAPVAPVATFSVADARNATATLVASGADVRVDVDCPGGIGELTLRRGPRAAWPARVVVRLLRFAVLEHVSAHDDRTRVAGQLGSDQVEVLSLVEERRKDPRRPATARDAMPIVRAPGRPDTDEPGRPVLRDSGWIDVTIPPSVLEPAAEAVRVRWIDAYRR